MGLAAARLSGIKIAKGKYIQHVDSDDWCEKNMLEELYNYAISNDADIVNCDFFVSYKNRESYIKNPVPSNCDLAFKRLLQGSIIHSLWVKFAKRSIYTDNNIDIISSNLCQWEDLLFSIQLFYYSKKICYLPMALIHYYQNSESITHNITRQSLNDSINTISELTSFIESTKSSDYHTELQYRYFSIYLYIIMYTTDQEQREYAKILTPNLCRLIFKHPALRPESKLILYFASNNRFMVIKLILNLIKFAKLLRTVWYSS